MVTADVGVVAEFSCIIVRARNTLRQSFPYYFARGPLLVSKSNYGPSRPCSHKYRVFGLQAPKIIDLYVTTQVTYTVTNAHQ